MTDTAARKNSPKGQGSEHIKTRLTRDEFNRVAARAGEWGLTVEQYCRTCMGYAYPAHNAMPD